ncbi:hypothetical protein PHYSODRAFT_295061 [Phytophthora sojae]|uniref:Uncharacterized protein n=1 Tax=Phytophthora sojae (strain P6497) TaxID=1094619 RepID=G4YNB9_PHYSP|nr:hypothetical protein PHYSODRAFT_295061 [Phytophthora sojae]EGZ30212.1 hypothetical protein PHYSODRAFT_295061 [Phytophthora sojae]|eukprot:XP_009517487.1 hypothetical protein PHYSODRAFT_295061 [Phytophthora sojae]
MFPFPFSVVFVGLTAGALFVLSFLLATKRESGRISITPAQEVVPAPKTSLRQSVYLFIAQGVLVAVYLTFSSVFTACSFKEQVALLLFLPIMKLGLKHMVARLAFGNPESIPAVVVFTVDVFNGLYSSICIQAAKSWRTSLLMISLNFSNTMISIFDIDQAAQLFRELDRKSNDSAQVQVLWDTNSDSRYRSSSLVQSAKWHTQTKLNAKGTTNTAGVMLLPSRTPASVTTRKSDISTALLFHLEYRALVGYIEAAIPMLYAMHLSILVHMSSVKYYPTLETLRRTSYKPMC